MNHDTPLTTAAEARAYIVALHAAGLLFHFDDPAEVVYCIETGLPTFKPEEFAAVNARVAELCALLDDPFEIALELIGTRENDYYENI